jgi:V/A-type H+-transporting ATPase subunit K
MRTLLAVVLLATIALCLSSTAFCEEHAAPPAGHSPSADGGPAEKTPVIWKALGAALAIGFAAFATAWAQSKIGSAAAGAIAEKPEVGGLMIVLEALPETIIILGFVIAIMIVGMK